MEPWMVERKRSVALRIGTACDSGKRLRTRSAERRASMGGGTCTSSLNLDALMQLAKKRTCLPEIIMSDESGIKDSE